MVKVFSTVNGGKKMSEAIENSKGKLGVESGNSVPEGCQAKFVDYPFTKEDVTFQDHLEKVKRFRPEVAVSLT